MLRADFATIAHWIPQDAQVLDLGCGDGALLNYLRETRGTHGYGVEISDANVLACIKNGVNVIQMDLESGLSGFESNFFDFVVLSQTLQAMKHTETLILEMLRVGRQAIVTFPNFGYWQHRWQVMLGRMPVSETLPYRWYDTPNIHLCTLRDFEGFCRDHRLRIRDRVVMRDGKVATFLPNLTGSLAVYRIDRPS
ncbi:MAG: methionine biosynthesis protein MetW [Burkholderiales bacterium]